MLSLFAIPPQSAGAQTDPRGNWRTWHTGHFRVHARAEHTAIAIMASREAERAWAELSRELVPPRGIVDLVLYDNVDFANGFTSVFPRNQVAIYLTSPAGEPGLSRYDDWMRLVVTHELTHVFHLDRSAGIWRLAQRVFGRAPGLFPNAYRPSWVGEGLAVYYESRLTGGGRLRGGYHAQVLAANAAAGRWPAPEDATFASAKWPAGLGPYAFGSRFMEWESRTSGAEVVPRFVESTSRRLWPLEISGPLARAGGERLGPGWKKFRAEWAEVDRPDEPARILVRGLRVEPNPQVSPDGARIAYVDADGKRTSHLVVRDLATWSEVGRHLITADVEHTWSGAELIVAQIEFRAPVEIRSALYRWRPGSAWRRVGPSRLTRPFVLGDSGVGAVLLTAAENDVVRLAGDSVVPLPAPPSDGWSHLAASPDGRWMAAARHRDARWDIVLWPASSPADVRQLTNDHALDDDPAWTSDGSTVVFVSERLGLPQIFGVRVATGEVVQFTREPTGARKPALSPDRTLFYSTILADGYAVVSRALEASAPEAARPENVPSFVPAPEITARETGYRPWSALVPRWWWPVGHDAGNAGLFLGAVTSAADQVGRFAYRAALAPAIDQRRFEWATAVAYTRWSSFVIDAAASQDWAPVGTVSPGPPPVFVSERTFTGALGGTLRWRRWRGDASIRAGLELERNSLVADNPVFQFSNPLLAGGVVSVRLARYDTRALAISAENGVVLTGTYRRRWETGSPRWQHELHGALRAYAALPLPGFARWVIATRVAGVFAEGTRPARRFGVGGESSDIYTIVPGVSVGSGGRELPMRGFPRSSFGFTRAVVGAAELRVPLFLIGKGIPKLPLAVDKVSLSFFGEMGAAGNGGPLDLTQFRDVGAELVTDWGLNYDTPLRVRVGGARGLTRWVDGSPGGTRWYVALGTAF